MKSLLFCLLFLPLLSFAQCDSTDVNLFPDVDPQFPGGLVEMKKFIQENIEYPDIKGYMCHQFTGRIYLKFIVCKDGTITNVRLMRKSNSEYDQIAIDLIEKMPNWIPAEVNDQPVATLVRFPITICLH